MTTPVLNPWRCPWCGVKGDDRCCQQRLDSLPDTEHPFAPERPKLAEPGVITFVQLTRTPRDMKFSRHLRELQDWLLREWAGTALTEDDLK